MSSVKSDKKRRQGNYFKNVVKEMKRVDWPTKKDLINYEVVVITFSLIAAVSIWVFDIMFRTGIHKLINL